MGVRFSFWAYGILAIAALALILYVVAEQSGLPDISQNLSNLVWVIVIAFIAYMFLKVLRR